MKRFIASFCVTVVAISPCCSQSLDSSFVSALFRGHDGTFVLCDKNKGEYFRYNSKRCAQRFLPASTYKIPNALIGLETGVIPDSNYVIKWDGNPEPIKEWERDHDLKSAIQFSVVWYFQELARRVGREREQRWLDTLDYGNKIIGDSVDRFWLDNSLRISADEQVEFLKKLYGETLPFSKRSMKIVKDIMSSEQIGKATIKFKTGTGHFEDPTDRATHFIGWLVGYVEREGEVYVFAFNVDGKDFDEVSRLRDSAPVEIMKEAGIL
ncbi:MAG TPA: class D beta-lactamase [Candidatus Acidoferrales bacterium]|nr:class D beta-lactamase [Candidatus Acidoferrales bacterium]